MELGKKLKSLFGLKEQQIGQLDKNMKNILVLILGLLLIGCHAPTATTLPCIIEKL
jgi:hypothetical protein